MAKIAIADLQQLYVSGVDIGPVDSLLDLFLADGELIAHGQPGYRGRAAIAGFLRGSRDSRRDRSRFGRIRHHVAQTALRFETPDRATGSCYFVAMGRVGADHWGVYDDVIVQRDALWRFERRAVTIEGAHPDGWIGSGAGPVRFVPQQ